MPSSVQELWLLSWNYDEDGSEWNLENLSKVCPNLKVLKIGDEFFEDDLVAEGVVEVLKEREMNDQAGLYGKGILMVSLEKLIIPTGLLGSGQLDDLREIVDEVIDIEDYPNFIELEY